MAETRLCPKFEAAFQLLGKRWSGLIVRVLLDGPKRYRDIAQAIPHLSEKVLSERLRSLEADGIVTRMVYPETPVRIIYELTDKGAALQPVMDEVQAWSDKWCDASQDTRGSRQ